MQGHESCRDMGRKHFLPNWRQCDFLSRTIFQAVNKRHHNCWQRVGQSKWPSGAWLSNNSNQTFRHASLAATDSDNCSSSTCRMRHAQYSRLGIIQHACATASQHSSSELKITQIFGMDITDYIRLHHWHRDKLERPYLSAVYVVHPQITRKSLHTGQMVQTFLNF